MRMPVPVASVAMVVSVGVTILPLMGMSFGILGAGIVLSQQG